MRDGKIAAYLCADEYCIFYFNTRLFQVANTNEYVQYILKIKSIIKYFELLTRKDVHLMSAAGLLSRN